MALEAHNQSNIVLATRERLSFLGMSGRQGKQKARADRLHRRLRA